MASPRLIASRVAELPLRDSGPSLAIARLYGNHLDRTRSDPKRFARRQALSVRNLENGRSIVRFAMGAGRIGVRKDEIALDYDAADALGIRFGEAVNLEVRPAQRLEVLRFYLSHQDMNIRFATQLALAGVLLGIASITLSVAFVVLT